MSNHVIKPRLKSEWVGRYVRLRIELTTKGGVIFDAGEIMRVTRNFGGLNLEAVHRCEHCIRRSVQSIRKVDESSVELLPLHFKPEGQ